MRNLSEIICEEIAAISCRFTWKHVAPLMQTELARLSLFMSFAGYLVLFSDVFFENGYPSFAGLLGHDVGASAAPTFFLSPVSKWQMIYFGLMFLMVGRLFFSWRCPDRLKEHGFRRIDFIQSCQRLTLKSSFVEMLDRVEMKEGEKGRISGFETKRVELTKLLFTEYDLWGRIRNEQRKKDAWKPPQAEGDRKQAEDDKQQQQAALMEFFSDCLSQDYDLAIYERRPWRVSSILFGLAGYTLLAIPALDLMQAIVLNLGGS